jgi:hypothetical protein
MLSKLRPRRPSPSMVVAFIALLVALGGTGYAASQLPNNSVGSKQLKNNAVTAKKIKNGAVKSNDVKNRSLQAKDFAVGEMPAGSMWSYRSDVPGGSPGQTVSMPDIPGLGKTSATCTSDGAAQLSVKNSSAGVGFQYVVTLTTGDGSKSSASGIFPGSVATITLPRSAQVTWQISPVPAGAPGPLATVVASNMVSSPGRVPVCSVSATAFFQDPVG